jgi:hypothetical protein
MEPVEIQVLELELLGAQRWEEEADELQEPLPLLLVETHMQQHHWWAQGLVAWGYMQVGHYFPPLPSV